MIGEARDQIDAAVGELEQTKAWIAKGKMPLDQTVDAFRRQIDAKTEAIPAASSVQDRITQLRSALGVLGAHLMDAKIAGQDIQTHTGEADAALMGAHEHRARANRLVADTTGENPNETEPVRRKILNTISILRTFQTDSQSSTAQFGGAVERVQELMAAADTLAKAADELAASIPGLGYLGDPEPYLVEAQFYPEEAAVAADQCIQQIQERTANW